MACNTLWPDVLRLSGTSLFLVFSHSSHRQQLACPNETVIMKFLFSTTCHLGLIANRKISQLSIDLNKIWFRAFWKIQRISKFFFLLLLNHVPSHTFLPKGINTSGCHYTYKKICMLIWPCGHPYTKTWIRCTVSSFLHPWNWFCAASPINTFPQC